MDSLYRNCEEFVRKIRDKLNNYYSPFFFQDILVMNSNRDPKDVSMAV